MRRLLLISLIVLTVSAFAQSSSALQSGEPAMVLTGVVYDINGAVIVDRVSVVAYGAGGKSYEATTDEEGIYKFNLPLGLYNIKASAPHFCSSQVARFRVVDSTHGKMSLDFVLELPETGDGCRYSISVEDKSKSRARKKHKIIIE